MNKICRIRFFLPILTLPSCVSRPYISGVIEGSVQEETKIYLVQPETLRDVAASYFGQVIDSALVNPDGSFAFHHTPDTKEPLLLELAIQTSGEYPNFILTEDPLRSNCMLVFWQPGEHLEISTGLDRRQVGESGKRFRTRC